MNRFSRDDLRELAALVQDIQRNIKKLRIDFEAERVSLVHAEKASGSIYIDFNKDDDQED